jgi:hypothetical protein
MKLINLLLILALAVIQLASSPTAEAGWWIPVKWGAKKGGSAGGKESGKESRGESRVQTPFQMAWKKEESL